VTFLAPEVVASMSTEPATGFASEATSYGNAAVLLALKTVGGSCETCQKIKKKTFLCYLILKKYNVMGDAYSLRIEMPRDRDTLYVVKKLSIFKGRFWLKCNFKCIIHNLLNL
jgi:hypothetical protein